MTRNGSRLTAIGLCTLLALAACFLAFSCNNSNQRTAMPSPAMVAMPANQPPQMMDVAMSMPPARFEASTPPPAGPSVSPSATPGVAFNYRYAFRLPGPRIAAVQERHAQLCERLTVARCRIIGMLYRVIDGRNIEARLELKLDPRIARHFGRTGAEAVVRAEGMLTESEISGTDAGSAIRDAGRGLAELEAELARVEARLRAAGTGERPELDFQAQHLRGQIRALRESRDAQQESLATTPMLFQYGSGDVVPGVAEQPTLQTALDGAIGNFLGGVTILLIILITLLPWALAGLLGWLLVRVARRRWFPPEPVASA